LKKDPATGIFSYSGAEETGFTRTITITDQPDGHKQVVTAVSWPVSGGTKTVSAELHLFNWR
jgi:hypothetical protein